MTTYYTIRVVEVNSEIFRKNFKRKCDFRVVALQLKINLPWKWRRQFQLILAVKQKQNTENQLLPVSQSVTNLHGASSYRPFVR